MKDRDALTVIKLLHEFGERAGRMAGLSEGAEALETIAGRALANGEDAVLCASIGKAAQMLRRRALKVGHETQ